MKSIGCAAATVRDPNCVKSTVVEQSRSLGEIRYELWCAADERTVNAYKKCLPSTTCDQFMDCVMEIAMAEP